jgi:lipopolysaccharide export LptBFGC system permease protein LptF
LSINNSMFPFLAAILAFRVYRKSSKRVQVIHAILLCLYLHGNDNVFLNYVVSRLYQ